MPKRVDIILNDEVQKFIETWPSNMYLQALKKYNEIFPLREIIKEKIKHK